jgi:hypothetical protein
VKEFTSCLKITKAGTTSIAGHFMATAIGASAALAANTDLASAQSATASRGTVYTGDVIGGKKVISALSR